MNEYDDQDMTGWDLSDRSDMNGLTIQGMCLSHEKPDSHCLPENLTGVTFIACNLDNVFVPTGNTTVKCSTRRFVAQQDGWDWEIDNNNNPIKILGA